MSTNKEPLKSEKHSDRRARGLLDRFLNLFTEVHPGEAATALLLMLNIFLLLGAYYLLKTIREPLILAGEGGGADVKSYAAAGVAGLLIVLVPIYSSLADRLSRVKLINGVTLFFISNLVIFYALSRVGVAVGIPFFIWVGIFNLVIIAQVWAFANDIYRVDEGKRLFPIAGLGASFGAIAGSSFAGGLVQAYGPYPIMLAGAGLLALCMLITNVIHVRTRRTARGELPAGKTAPEKELPAADSAAADRRQNQNGFALVLSHRYLILIALLMVLSNLVNTTGEYILGETVSSIARSRAASDVEAEKLIGGFYGNYFTWVNVISALIQAFVVSRVLKHMGVGAALLVLPLVALAGYAVLAFLPVLAVIRSVKIAENSVDYSLQNTARNALYLPTSRAVKYKAKQANDTFFVRFGDVLSGGLVFAGLHWLGFAPRHFALVNAAFVLLWIVVAVGLGRHFASLGGKRLAEAEGAATTAKA